MEFFKILFICSYGAKSHLSVPLWSETHSFESRLCPPGVNYLYNNSLNYLKPCLSKCFDVPKVFWINRTLLSLDISDIFGDAYGMISPDLILYNLVLKWTSSGSFSVQLAYWHNLWFFSPLLFFCYSHLRTKFFSGRTQHWS